MEKPTSAENPPTKEELIEEKDVKREVSPFSRTAPKIPIVKTNIPFKPGGIPAKRPMPVVGNPFNKPAPKADAGNTEGI
jgi:hypothetical protein